MNDKWHVNNAFAIKIGNRWFYKFGKQGQVQTAWSLAGAQLFQQHECDVMIDKLKKKGKKPILHTIISFDLDVA